MKLTENSDEIIIRHILVGKRIIGSDKQDTIKLIKKLNKFMKSKDFQKSIGNK